jgi:hypothetical protein
MKIKILCVLITLLVGCRVGSNLNLTILQVESLDSIEEGKQAIQEVQDCLGTDESFDFVDLIIVADEVIESCGRVATLCASDTGVFVTQKHYDDIQRFPTIWVAQLKHELGHIAHNIMYGNLDSKHESAWFEGRQAIFICNQLER